MATYSQYTVPTVDKFDDKGYELVDIYRSRTWHASSGNGTETFEQTSLTTTTGYWYEIFPLRFWCDRTATYTIYDDNNNAINSDWSNASNASFEFYHTTSSDLYSVPIWKSDAALGAIADTATSGVIHVTQGPIILTGGMKIKAKWTHTYSYPSYQEDFICMFDFMVKKYVNNT